MSTARYSKWDGADITHAEQQPVNLLSDRSLDRSHLSSSDRGLCRLGPAFMHEAHQRAPERIPLRAIVVDGQVETRTDADFENAALGRGDSPAGDGSPGLAAASTDAPDGIASHRDRTPCYRLRRLKVPVAQPAGRALPTKTQAMVRRSTAPVARGRIRSAARSASTRCRSSCRGFRY